MILCHEWSFQLLLFALQMSIVQSTYHLIHVIALMESIELNSIQYLFIDLRPISSKGLFALVQ